MVRPAVTDSCSDRCDDSYSDSHGYVMVAFMVIVIIPVTFTAMVTDGVRVEGTVRDIIRVSFGPMSKFSVVLGRILRLVLRRDKVRVRAIGLA